MSKRYYGINKLVLVKSLRITRWLSSFECFEKQGENLWQYAKITQISPLNNL